MQRRNFVSLKIKTLIAILPLALLFVAFCFFAVNSASNQRLKKAVKERASSLADCTAVMASDSLHDPGNQVAATKLQEHLVSISHLPEVLSVEVINQNGKVKAHSDKTRLGQSDLSEGTQKALSSDIAITVESQTKNKPSIIASSPVRFKDNRLGTVVVAISSDFLTKSASQANRQLTGLSLVFVSAAILFAAFITYFYGTPLLALAKVSHALAQGELDTRADDKRSDEIGLVGAGINRMAANLQTVLLREQTNFQSLQERVRELRAFTEAVLQGNYEDQAKVEYIDEIGQLAMSINEVVRHMRRLNDEISNSSVAQDSANSPNYDPAMPPNKEQAGFVDYNRPLPPKPQRPTKRRPKSQLSRGIPEEIETIICAAPPTPTIAPTPVPNAAQAVQTNIEPAEGESDPPSMENSLVAIDSGFGLSQSGELNNSQKEYVSHLNQLGYGQTALVATGGTEDSYPFLRAVLESEGFSVIHASTVAEMLDIATVIEPQLIMIEFNDMASGNQHAVNKLRTTQECAHTSLIVLEANIRSKVPYASMKDIIQIIIPNSDEELQVMIREALAEILLVGGANPFLSQEKPL